VPGDKFHSAPGNDPLVPGLDPRIHDALSDLHAYVLVLDADWRRVAARLELSRGTDATAPERAQLQRRHDELAEELDALRGTIAKLRAYADPDGLYL
jgi:hypothetical protein